MELSIFVQCMIIIFTIVGSCGNPTVSHACDKHAEKMCKCSNVDQVEETPLKMCSYKEGDNELCKPCQDIVRDSATCAECPDLTRPATVVKDNITCAECRDLACTTCNASSVGLTNEQTTAVEDNATCNKCLKLACNASTVRLTNGQTTVPTIKDGHNLQNYPKGHSIKRTHKWCSIKVNSFNERLMCKTWRHKKECVLKCSKEDGRFNKYSFYFICKRERNSWRIVIKPCVAAQSKGGRLRIVSRGVPFNMTIIRRRTGVRDFFPMKQTDVGGGHVYNQPPRTTNHHEESRNKNELWIREVRFYYRNHLLLQRYFLQLVMIVIIMSMMAIFLPWLIY